MFTMSSITSYLLIGVAITCAIYFISKKTLTFRELVTFVLSISITFIILDLFASGVSQGVRQGAGFGLGFTQVAGDGNTLPRHYYEPVVEGMDDKVAIDYYNRYNPNKRGPQPIIVGETDSSVANFEQPSIILQHYAKNPFKTM